MTNEEKALEAARVIKEEIGISEHSIPRVAEIIDWCLTWKDQKFKEYLEKKKTYYSQALTTFDVMRKRVFDEIINELFKED